MQDKKAYSLFAKIHFPITSSTEKKSDLPML